MATKAELFRAASQRTRHEAPKVKKPPRRSIIDPLHTDTRNVTKRADKEKGMALEDSMSGRPSRKSTRASSHHGRADTAIVRAVRAKHQSAKSRAQRSLVARKK